MLEIIIHQTQVDILRELLFMPSATFSQLQKVAGLESDYFKFHIAKLVSAGYVEKNAAAYRLTHKGKEYANKLDTDQKAIEHQPKSAVIIVVFNEKNEVLVQERLKHPYFGFWGYPGGKIRWGETIMQAGNRELQEEAGMTAALHYKGVYHERAVSAETNEILEDKIFHILRGNNTSELMRKNFEGGHNTWMSLEKLATIDKKYASCDTETRIAKGELSFIELVQTYTNDEF